MFRRRLLWQLFPSYLVIILISLLVVTLFSSHSLKNFYFKSVKESHDAVIALYQEDFARKLANKKLTDIQELVNLIDEKTSIRFTLISPIGAIFADSRETPLFMDDHSNRPEFIEAVNGKSSSSIRYSNTLKKDMLYYAVPVYDENKLIAVIRTSVPITWLDSNLKDIYQKIILGGILAAFFSGIVSYSFTRRIKKPLEILEKGAMRFADGDLSKRIPIPSINELGDLTESMNIMAAQLNDRINIITQQNKEQEAIFSNMTEGILAIDSKYKIIKINRQAKDLLDINDDNVQKKFLHKVMDNSSFMEYVKEIFELNQPLKKELLVNNGEKYIQANSTVIRDRKDRVLAIVVLNDITRVNQLEKIRKDFVANVSHELKTPITTIKGFIETLQEGAINDKEEAQHFLSIISKHTSRLNAIIEDLLSLSRLEQDRDLNLNIETVDLMKLLYSATQVCEVNAGAKAISVSLHLKEKIFIDVDVSLFEQALINLIDNAIKYSNEGTRVDIYAEKNEKEVIIEIKDQGAGIPEENLSRIFERFYRVDKARSRKAGGTGLGLAIVKHIVQCMNGQISVKSELNKGSSFTIKLPQYSK